MFIGDLKYGEVAEERVIEVLTLKNPGASFEKGGRKKEYDILMTREDGTTQKWEVKRDRRALETGNVAMELAYKGNPSGIAATEADFICYMIGETLYCIKPSVLMEEVATDETGRGCNGGDGWKSKLWLMKLTHFQDICEVLE